MSYKLHAVLAALAAGLLFANPLVLAQEATPDTAPAAAPLPPVVPVFTVDKTSLANGGVVTVTGQAAPGKPVYLEVFNEKPVTGSFFDSRPNKETGKIPYKLYMASEIPAFYRIHVPRETQPILDDFKKEGRPWSYSSALSNTGGEVVYREPGKHPITAYQASLQAGIVGSRGEVLPTLDDKERVRRSMQIMKARFRTVDKLFAANVDVKDDGSFSAQIKIPEGSAPGKYFITAATSKKAVSESVVVENQISFPIRYMENAGTSLNIFIPFLIVLALATFGVLMGAGGGFIINPIMLMMFPIPHNVVAGTVTPTVLFSQASGVVNYSKIKFISWKVGITLGIAMLAGGFIGPVLTTMITADQYKFVFGWILFILAALMFWQTTPGYMAKNKKEQAILKEFQKRAEEAAAAKAAKA
ncbi:MAG: sulfite exporter TauE/SafE family protein [Rhodocyclaceae bacterium]|nr:sulfite exporter TauE/SafE family protein [Rhodocyclaceae bacterium]